MDSGVMALEALALQIRQQEQMQEKEKKLEEERKKEQIRLDKMMKGGKVANPLLLIMFIEMQGMKSLSKSANPLLERNDSIHEQYLAKLREIAKLNQKLKKLLEDPNYDQADQTTALDLDNQIAQLQVALQEVQQKGQALWTLNFQPVENNIQSTSNMAATAIHLLYQSRESFLRTTN